MWPRPIDLRALRSATHLRALLVPLVSVCLLGADSAFALDLLVPDQFATIQLAIDNANDGDDVVVSAGTYPETLNFQGKVITVRSIDGAEFTTIDAGLLDTTVSFVTGEGPGSVLRGFTIRGGQPSGSLLDCAGGIRIVSASPTIEDNIIEGNSAFWCGAGISCEGGAPLIANNTIRNNTFFCLIADAPCGQGGGIYCSDSQAVIRGNVIESNSAPANGGAIAVVGALSNVEIIDNFIVANSGGFGGGISVVGSGAVANIRNNLIADNNAVGYSTLIGPIAGTGGGIYSSGTAILSQCSILNNLAVLPPFMGVSVGGGISVNSTATQVVSNCILFGNDATLDQEIYLEGTSTIDVSYSDVAGGYVGVGNIDADPLLQTGPLGDFYLSHVAAGQPADSPCIDAGDPTSPQILGSTRTDGFTDTGIVDMGFHVVSDQLPFIRGDVNGDGVVSGLIDGLFLLSYQFGGGTAPPCLDAADTDDNGTVVGLLDALFLLNFQFVPLSPPPPPPNTCGTDPTPDTTDCLGVSCP